MLTDGQTDRRTSSIHQPELLCNPAKNQTWAITAWGAYIVRRVLLGMIGNQENNDLEKR